MAAGRLSSPDFGSYQAVDYRPDQWVGMSGREARAEYRRFLSAIPDRVSAFEDFLRRNGLPTGLERADLQELNDWFLRNVRADSTGAWPELQWRSIAMDIGLYLGQAVIALHNNLRWDFAATAPTSVEYRQHVIVGFQRAGYTRHRVSPSAVMFTYATRAIHKDRVEIVIVQDEPMEFDAGPIEEQRFVEFFDAVNEMA